MLTAQKPQARVQRSPAIMKVAVPWLQHSQRFGHCADLANGVEFQVADERLGGRKKTGLDGKPDLDPVRLPLDVQGGIDFRARHGKGKYARRRGGRQMAASGCRLHACRDAKTTVAGWRAHPVDCAHGCDV